MLRLRDNDVIYNNSGNFGAVQNMNYIEGGFYISLGDGSVTFIPEQDCTENERICFYAYHEFYRDTGGVRPISAPEPQIITEPDDEEKAAMAEAIIDMSLQINELKMAIETLKGGV